MYHRKRYPVEKSRYYQCVGRLLPHRIGQIFHELGFKTWVNPKQGNDIDLKVFLGNKLTIAIEALNWSVGSVLSEKRKNNIIKNLTKYNCKRLLIYTVLNKNAPEDLEDFTRNRISLIKIGYQLLPKEFFKFFFEKRQIDFRKIDSSETKEDIKKKLANYLLQSCIMNDSELAYTAMFQPFFNIGFLLEPFKRKNLIKKLKRKLELELNILFDEIGSKEYWIKTKNGEIYIREYLRKFVNNLVESLRKTLISYEYYVFKRHSENDVIFYSFIPNKLYHGTTTKFLSSIQKDGLCASKAGRFRWKDRWGRVKKVCLTDNMYIAEKYAINAAKVAGGKPIVLEINVKGIKKNAKVRFEFLGKRCPINFYREIYFRDDISPKRIKSWYLLPKTSSCKLCLILIEE
ncbi:MAG: hypothetical protein ACTSX6_06415 [Candidatus Heimdallarchaeaceae archaeon]